ncbi:MAG: glycosyltransferase [Gemmatimonadetes bacterium]|nr:MAG: glycosyltransferase [Gemmatimonadota bacterium]
MNASAPSTLYSIVVPVYNTAQSLVELSDRVHAVFEQLPAADYELIFIDDASPSPETWRVLTQLAQSNSHIRIIQLMRNFGQQAATLCGMARARGDYIITMDDDLQHYPEDIPKLIAQQHHDIVIIEFRKKYHSAFKRITSKLKGWFDHILIGKPKHIQLSSFRLIRRSVIDAMLTIHTPNPFIPALMFYVSKDIVGVPAEHGKRKEGKTGYTFGKLVRVFSNLIINNSAFLLKSIGYIGITISLFSFLLALYILIKKVVWGVAIAGWSSLMVTILFIGGLLLFAIGVIGEYLLRIISGVEHKPTYVIRQQQGLEA